MPADDWTARLGDYRRQGRSSADIAEIAAHLEARGPRQPRASRAKTTVTRQAVQLPPTTPRATDDPSQGWEALLAALADLDASGWPTVYLASGYPARSDYLPPDLEPGHVYRDAAGHVNVRLMVGGDRLVFVLPEVGGSLVNPKGPGLRHVGLLTTYARGSTYHLPAFRAADLRKGRPVELRREPDNPHDRNAVALWVPGGRAPFGYVQRGRAASLAKRLDTGERMAAVTLFGPARGRPRTADDDAASAHLVIGSAADLLTMLGAYDAG